MSRGPTWAEDEKRVCEYMWKAGKTDTEIAAVLSQRTENAIRTYRIGNGWVSQKVRPQITVAPVKKVVEAPIVAPVHADSLPDIGEQVAKLIEKQTLMETTLWAINCKVGELIELQKAANSMSKDGLELWRAADARSRAATKA